MAAGVLAFVSAEDRVNRKSRIGWGSRLTRCSERSLSKREGGDGTEDNVELRCRPAFWAGGNDFVRPIQIPAEIEKRLFNVWQISGAHNDPERQNRNPNQSPNTKIASDIASKFAKEWVPARAQ